MIVSTYIARGYDIRARSATQRRTQPRMRVLKLGPSDFSAIMLVIPISKSELADQKSSLSSDGDSIYYPMSELGAQVEPKPEFEVLFNNFPRIFFFTLSPPQHNIYPFIFVFLVLLFVLLLFCWWGKGNAIIVSTVKQNEKLLSPCGAKCVLVCLLLQCFGSPQCIPGSQSWTH